MIRRFATRCGASALAVLKAIDILACAVWLGSLYPFGLAARPTGRQMISSYVGEAAAGGMAWAVRAAWAIDRVAMLLGDAPDHCGRAFRRYQFLDD